MEMMVSTEDMNYLAQQSSDRISMILAGMTSLMNDTDQKVEVMESQTWFQRMVKTITGKNKLAKEEIQQNHDKLNAYMSQAMAELYNRDCINQEIMMSLGTQINELYADHLQLKEMLGAFVTKLNEKIESIDNFHMLNTEIEQGVYSGYESIVAICLVMSQMDKRVLEDNRKLDILKRSMQNQGILEQSDMMLTDFLLSIINMPDDKVGLIYMELGSIPENFVAKLVLDTIESYHFLPDMAKKMKNKNSVVTSIIENNQLDDGIALNISDVYDDFMESKCSLAYAAIETSKESENTLNGRIYPDKSNVTSIMKEDSGLLVLDLTWHYYVENYDSCKNSMHILEKYARKEDAEAMYCLGVLYKFTKDDENNYFSIYEGRDEKLGLEYIEKAAKQGHPDARIKMAKYYSENGDKQKGIMIMEELIADSKEEDANELYALIELLCDEDVEEFLFDVDNKEEDEKRVMELLAKCAALDHAEALFWMAEVHRTGVMEYIGYEENVKDYKSNLEQAVVFQHEEATLELALNYYFGDNGYSQNYNKAHKYLEKDILCFNAKAEYVHGLLHWYGEGGIEEDDISAVLCFKRASEKGVMNANIILAEAYYKDIGVVMINYEERMETSQQYLNKIIYECDDDDDLVEKAREMREEWFGY